MMTTALTVARNVFEVSSFNDLPVESKSQIALVEAVAGSYATVSQIARFLSIYRDYVNNSPVLLKQVQTAHARETYRQGDALTLEQLALLCETSVQHVSRYVIKLRRKLVNGLFLSLIHI